MKKIRIIAELEEDVFDELCSYREDRVNILYAEDEESYDLEGIESRMKEEA